MITIHDGRARIDVRLGKHLHIFRNGNDTNALGVFMVIALHANADGWAWPSTTRLNAETGLHSEAAIERSIQYLCTVKIDGRLIMRRYRMKGHWNRSCYRIFPDRDGAL